MLQDSVDLTTIRRVLVIKLRHHGDVLLTSPLFQVLKNHAPHLEIDALVFRETQEMLQNHPAIRQVHTVERSHRLSLWNGLMQEIRLIRTLRAQRYDLLIHLTDHARGARLARVLNARYRVARDFPSRRGLLWRRTFTHFYKTPSKPRHMVEQHLDALRRIGVYPGLDERKLVFVEGPEETAVVDRCMAEHGLNEKGFIHVHPTSRWLFKAWDEKKMAEFIRTLEVRGERIIVTTGPDEIELRIARRMLAGAGAGTVDLSGKLSLKGLGALTRRAKCFVGVDSAPMHLAAAVGTPVVALFGPTDESVWGPWQVPHRVISQPFSCRPCGQDGCGGGKVSECITTVSVERALQAVKELTGSPESSVRLVERKPHLL